MTDKIENAEQLRRLIFCLRCGNQVGSRAAFADIELDELPHPKRQTMISKILGWFGYRLIKV